MSLRLIGVVLLAAGYFLHPGFYILGGAAIVVSLAFHGLFSLAGRASPGRTYRPTNRSHTSTPMQANESRFGSPFGP